MVVCIAKLCPTLCDPMDCHPPDSSVHAISQAWEWVTFTSPGDHPSPGIEPTSTHISCTACRFFPAELLGMYIMWNARPDELQAGIKITERSNNLRYADDTTLSEECVISLVLSRCNKDLKERTSVTAWLQLVYKAWGQADLNGEAPNNPGSLFL